MILPGLLTIITPVLIGLFFGAEPLGGYMAGVLVSGVMWAIFQNNAGGAWDNAKKSFEAGVMIEGEMTYKGSDSHKAAITGDTVGDPFKDTSGPSMNILIKLTCLVGLVLAPMLGGHNSHDMADAMNNEKVWVDEHGNKHTIMGDSEMFFSGEGENKEIIINLTTEGDLTVATIETMSMVDGKEVKEIQKIKGTETQVRAKLAKFESSKGLHKEHEGTDSMNKEVKVEMEEGEDGNVKAIVTTTKTENGESSTTEEIFEGTMEEVKANLKTLEDVEVKIEKKVIKEVVEEVEETN
jgi:K(+)-stimulated pyrophosphate-energized sodium pump